MFGLSKILLKQNHVISHHLKEEPHKKWV